MGRKLIITQKYLKYCRKIQIALFLFQMFIISGLIYFKCNYVINVTPSLPLGIYRLKKPDNLKTGDVVLFDLNVDIKERMAERGYIPDKKTKLLKTIGAFENNKIEIIDNFLYVDDENYGEILTYDLSGSKLPQIEIKVEKGYFLALTKQNLSFDSRYFGQIKLERIEKKAELIYRFKDKKTGGENNGN